MFPFKSHIMKLFRIFIALVLALSFPALSSAKVGKPKVKYPTSRGGKVETLQTDGMFVRTEVAEGLTHYLFEGHDEVSGAVQSVNVLEVDLDNENYKVVFSYGSDSTSAAAVKHDAIAAINATYERDASYIRVDGQNHSEVSIPSGHLRFWKHDGAIITDGERKVAIVNGAAGKNATDEGGEIAAAFYSKLKAENVFSGSPMLIDDFDPIGAVFVPDTLDATQLKELKYEDFRRHQGMRHPRTAVALTADNDLLLIVVDGRNHTASGMTAKELSLFIAKHFNPRWALNMDGGGSSTMVIKGYGAEDTNVLNYPYDNRRYDHYGQRRICTHIIIKKAN